MCGIVGVTGNNDATNILLDGLQQLEYRGYDSAGIYVNDQNGKDFLVKKVVFPIYAQKLVQKLRVQQESGIHAGLHMGFLAKLTLILMYQQMVVSS